MQRINERTCVCIMLVRGGAQCMCSQDLFCFCFSPHSMPHSVVPTAVTHSRFLRPPPLSHSLHTCSCSVAACPGLWVCCATGSCCGQTHNNNNINNNDNDGSIGVGLCRRCCGCKQLLNLLNHPQPLCLDQPSTHPNNTFRCVHTTPLPTS